MNDSFAAEVRVQVARARAYLRAAVQAGDDYLAEAFSARLRELLRLATTHDVAV